MPKRIIYPNESGGVSVIIPAPEFMCALQKERSASYTDEDLLMVIMQIIAEKDVPTGTPYKIVDTSEIPTDRTFRAVWEADFTNPDGVGA